MDVIVKEVAAFDREVTISVPASQVDRQMDQELKRLASQVRLPGFRPGKIPKNVLESRFRDQIASAVIEQLIQESYPDALAEKELRPVDNVPKLTFEKLTRGADFTYTARIQVYPQVEPQGYSGLTLTQRNATVIDADIDEVLENIRTEHGRYEADADRQAALGDQVVLDYAGSIDGVPFEGGKADAHVLELGKGQFIAGFESQLVGSRAGETVQVRVTFPADYRATHLAGKEALFDCTIQEVRGRVLPPIDDALAELTGIKTGGLAELRVKVREGLEDQAQRESKRQLKQEMLKQLKDNNPINELPDTLLKKECQAMVAQGKQEFRSQGLDPEQLGLSDAEWEGRFEDKAKERIVLGLVMGTIAEKEQVEVDDATLEAHLDRIAATYGDQARAMKKWVQEDENRMDDFRNSAMEQQVVDWIIAHSTVTEQTCTLKQLMGKFDPGEAEKNAETSQELSD